ncbi:MAG: BON domain-containing protein [Candidatus Binatia bacterium]
MRATVQFLLVAILFAASIAGCTALTGKTAGQNIDDATITASVKTKLATDQDASTLTKIDVDTNTGTVILNGVVADAAMKQRASELARQVSGVREVVNNLQLQASN